MRGQFDTAKKENRRKADEAEARKKVKAVSSNKLAGGLNAFMSNFDYIDSSIEVLDHSQDLSWELVEGGTWNETNKQSEQAMSEKFKVLLKLAASRVSPLSPLPWRL